MPHLLVANTPWVRVGSTEQGHLAEDNTPYCVVGQEKLRTAAPKDGTAMGCT